MRRAFAGLRAARIRPDKGVRIALAAAGIVFLAACAPTDGTGTAEIAVPTIEAAATSVAPTTDPPTTAAPPTTVAPTTTAPASTAAPTTVPPTTRAPRPRPLPKPLPKPAPKPAPRPTVAPAPSTCDSSYPDVCLKDGIGDYDCKPGKGNGPNYVYQRVTVLQPDPFGLDADGDGIGCEKSG